MWATLACRACEEDSPSLQLPVEVTLEQGQGMQGSVTGEPGLL